MRDELEAIRNDEKIPPDYDDLKKRRLNRKASVEKKEVKNEEDQDKDKKDN